MSFGFLTTAYLGTYVVLLDSSGVTDIFEEMANSVKSLSLSEQSTFSRDVPPPLMGGVRIDIASNQSDSLALPPCAVLSDLVRQSVANSIVAICILDSMQNCFYVCGKRI